jgi:hypothetical protein
LKNKEVLNSIIKMSDEKFTEVSFDLYTGPKFYYNDCYSKTLKVEFYKEGKLWKVLEDPNGISVVKKWKWLDEVEGDLQTEIQWRIIDKSRRSMELVANYRGETE